MKNPFVMYFLLIILTILSSCTPIAKNNLNDAGFLTNEPCAAPCFYGMMPGTTTIESAKRIIKDNANIFNDCKNDKSTDNNNWAVITCDFVLIEFQNNLIYYIEFKPSIPITANQVVALYGEPEKVCAYQSSILPDEPSRVQMNFCYSKINTSVIFIEQDGNIYNIKSDAPVNNIGYSNEELTKSDCGCSNNSWKGFGDYKADLIPN